MTMKRRQAFCMECRKQTEYTLRKTSIKKNIREKEYTFDITTAVCRECGCEVNIPGLLNRNIANIDAQYREFENIITIDEIQKLGKVYDLGKAPLSLALGFGEVTITRYLAGQVPSKEYSDIMRKALSDTSVMAELLEQNKDKIAPTAYKKAVTSIEELNRLFHVPEKMLMIISYIFNTLEEVTPLALQKILYYVQGLYYSRYQSPIFDADCEAWVHGPVYRQIYELFNKFKYDPIDDPRFELLKGKSEELTTEEKEIIKLVVDTFGIYGGKTLERITHKETPWIKAREGYSDNEPSCEEISKESIKEYFETIRKEYDMDSVDGIREYIQTKLD